MRQLGGIFLVILMILFGQGARAAESQPEKTELPQAEEEVVVEKKPPEKPPEVLPEFVPGEPLFSPFAPYAITFGPGPLTGMLAPYGYGGAEDTLIRGWKSHRLGPVRVSPYFEYNALYRSNVFQTYSNKNSDFVNMINPGIRFELPVAGTHKLSIGYLGNYFIYSRFNDISHYDHNLNADAALNFSKLSIRVGNAYRNATEEPSLVQNGPFFTFDRERPYNRITPYFQAAYRMADRWRIETNYQFDYLSYTKRIDRVNSYYYNTFGGTVYYKFWPKTSALVQYIAVIRTHPFDSSQDNMVHTPLAGLTWEPTAKLSGTIKAGYTIADYSDSDRGTQGFNPDGVALSIQILYKLSRFTQMSLVAQRSLQEDVDTGNASYFNSGLLFTVSHFWHYFNVTSYASFSYYNNHYVYSSIDPNTLAYKKRDDNIIYAAAGLSRPLTPYLRLRLNYLYYNRGSNFSYYPTNEHKLIFGIQTSF